MCPKKIKKDQSYAPKSVSYQDYLIGSLKAPEEAQGYLNAVVKGGDLNVLVLALQNVLEAQKGNT